MYVHGSHFGRVTKGPLYELMPSLPKKIPNDNALVGQGVSEKGIFKNIDYIRVYVYSFRAGADTNSWG